MENLMFTDKNLEDIKFIDYGLSTKIGFKSFGGNYQSQPFEKLVNHAVLSLPENDVYSLGILLISIETGYEGKFDEIFLEYREKKLN